MLSVVLISKELFKSLDQACQKDIWGKCVYDSMFADYLYKLKLSAMESLP